MFVRDSSFFFVCASGTLTLSVKACGLQFDIFGSSGCNINTTYDEGAGRTSFSIIYSVTDTGGSTASVSRTINIIPVCGAGETFCSDATCSQDGICLEAAPLFEPSPNQPPAIQLKTEPPFGEAIELKKGKSYDPCSGDTTPTADSPCELGAVAIDPEDGDISYKVGEIVKTLIYVFPTAPTGCL